MRCAKCGGLILVDRLVLFDHDSGEVRELDRDVLPLRRDIAFYDGIGAGWQAMEGEPYVSLGETAWHARCAGGGS